MGDCLQIVFPDQFIVPFVKKEIFSCSLEVDLTKYSESKCTYQNDSIYIFNNDKIISKNKSIQILINGLHNPHGLFNTSPFKALLKRGSAIRAINSNLLTIKMKEYSEIINWKVFPSSPSIGASANYFFKFNLLDIIKPGDTINLEIPSSLTRNSFELSISSDQMGNLSVQANENEHTLVITSNNFVPYNSSISLMLQGFKNPESVAPTSPFSIAMKQNNEIYSSFVDFTGYTSYEPLNLGFASLNYSNDFIGEPNTLTFSLKLKGNVPKNGKIEIQLPEDLVYMNHLSCSSDSFKTECSSKSNNMLTLQDFPNELLANVLYKVQIQGYNNPTTSTNFEKASSYSIKTYDSKGYLIESVKNEVPAKYSCAENCEKCTNNFTNCTECQTNYMFLGTKCIAECPSSHYTPDSHHCLQCLTPDSCTSCDPAEPNRCIQCVGDHILFQGDCFPNTLSYQEFIENMKNSSFFEANSNKNLAKNSNSTLKQSSADLIFFYNTEYDNKPYISGYLLFSLFFILANKLIFKNRTISFLSSLVFLWCLMDFLCIGAAIVKFLFIEKYVFFLCFIFIATFHFFLHLVMSYNLWRVLSNDAEYHQHLEGNFGFKIPHFFIFAINYRFSYLLFSGIGKYGAVNFSLQTRQDIERIMLRGMIVSGLLAVAVIGLLSTYIIIVIVGDDFANLPWFFMEFLGFELLYFLAQLLRICVKQDVLTRKPPSLEIDVNSIAKHHETNKSSPKNMSLARKSKAFLSNVLSNLTSGKKNHEFMSLKNDKEVQNKSQSPLLPTNGLKNQPTKEISFTLSQDSQGFLVLLLSFY